MSSSNIPYARQLIEQAIKDMKDPSHTRSGVTRLLRTALKHMTRKPRETTGEPMARKAYMTKSVIAKVRKCRQDNPTLKVHSIARIYGTDPKRTAEVLGETK